MARQTRNEQRTAAWTEDIGKIVEILDACQADRDRLAAENAALLLVIRGNADQYCASVNEMRNENARLRAVLDEREAHRARSA